MYHKSHLTQYGKGGPFYAPSAKCLTTTAGADRRTSPLARRPDTGIHPLGRRGRDGRRAGALLDDRPPVRHRQLQLGLWVTRPACARGARPRVREGTPMTAATRHQGLSAALVERAAAKVRARQAAKAAAAAKPSSRR